MVSKKIPTQLCLIGGGASIKEGIDKGLWNRLEGKWTIGCNYSFNYSIPTLLTFVDDKFYKEEYKKLEKLPMIIGAEFKGKILSNTILLKTHHEYIRDIKIKGVYKKSLSGLFALSLGIYLLEEGEIFLLGMDYGAFRTKDYEKDCKSVNELKEITKVDVNKVALTHFYQGRINHRGIGKVSYYNSEGRAERDFGVYKNSNIKIFNVSMVSKIPSSIFPKINYSQFFNKLDNNIYNQDELRNHIKSLLIQ